MSLENSTSKKHAELLDKKALSLKGGGDKRVDAQHKRGKLTARERISLLLDVGTFEELDPLVLHRSTDFGLENQQYLGDAVVTGYGEVTEDSRLCMLRILPFWVGRCQRQWQTKYAK